MIKQLSTKIVYKNKWMTIREDQVEFQNRHKGIYGVIEKPDFSLIAPFDGEKFILVNQYRYPIGKASWEFPQGSYEDKPETPATSVALKELEEETGYIAHTIKKIGYLYQANGSSSQGFTLFYASDLVKTKQHLEESELGMEVRAFSLQQLEKMILEGEIFDAPTVSAYALLKLKKII